MKILFIVADLFLSEPIGLMHLAAICKKNMHIVKLITLKKHNVLKTVYEFNPDIIAYSAMTPDANIFIEADLSIKKWMMANNKKIVRIMGGPHSTYFPEILSICDLDSICIGEGDNAIIKIIDNVQSGKGLSCIANVLCKENYNLGLQKKELITDIDALPFPDRDIVNDAVPYYRFMRMRSFLTSRGCPYDCSYCHNHVFNDMFKECGAVLRRRSVEGVIEEIKYTLKQNPHVKFIRFADDTFAHKIDNWLVKFMERYSKEIKLPFYCLMRSNTLTYDMAKLLSESGCHSIGMSVETGNENIRNDILNRNLSDEVVIKSFTNARACNINTFGNTMLGLPGTNSKDDFYSFIFAKKLKLTVPTFGIFCPYPKTKLTDYAIEKGFLEKDYKYDMKYTSESALKGFSKKDKMKQVRMTYLAPIFCQLPDCLIPVFRTLLTISVSKLFALIGSIYLIYRTGTKIFPRVYPFNPVLFYKILKDTIIFQNPKQNNK